MPIVLKYGSPGPILGAAFSGGQGHHKNVIQQDLLGLWQQGQQQQFQAQQNSLARAQQAHLQFQERAQQEEQNRLGRNLQVTQRLNAEKFQAEQAGLQRTFQEGQQKTLLDATDRRQAANDVRDFYTRTFFSLPQIPEFADAAQRKSLTDTRSAIQGLLSKGFDTSDPEIRKHLDEKIAEYSSGVSALHDSYSPAAAANRGTIYRDAQGKAYDEPGEGRTAYDLKTNEPILADQLAAQQKQAAEQAKQAEKFQKEQREYAKLHREEAQRLADANVPAKGQAAKPWTEYVDEARKNLGMIGITAPQMPGQAASQPVQPVGNPPEAQPVQYDPQAVETYNQMQDMLARGAQSWTEGGDTPSGKVNFHGSSIAQKWGLGGTFGLSAPRVGSAPAATASGAPQFKTDAEREQWRQALIKGGYGDPDAPAQSPETNPIDPTTGQTAGAQPAPATQSDYTDEKTGNVYRKRGDTWVRVK